jgi:hypothetical protein
MEDDQMPPPRDIFLEDFLYPMERRFPPARRRVFRVSLLPLFALVALVALFVAFLVGYSVGDPDLNCGWVIGYMTGFPRCP